MKHFIARIALPCIVTSLFAQAQTNQPSAFKFEVCSIRPSGNQAGGGGSYLPTPNGFRIAATLRELVLIAYGPPGSNTLWQTNAIFKPAWIGTDRYDIDARVSQADLHAWQGRSRNHELLRLALRAELQDRFKLAVHEQPEKRKVYELSIAKGGPKLKAVVPGATLPVGVKLADGGVMTPIGDRASGGWNFVGATMQDLAGFLSAGGIPARDRTGLSGHFDFPLRRVETLPGEDPVFLHPVGQLGLQVKPGMENIPTLVIDRAERPTPN